jgi:ornithine cyclodeaminase
MRVVDLATIQRAIRPAELLDAIADAFVAFSQGRVEVPPPGHLALPEHDGELHVKFGHVRGTGTFTVKLATGFYRNAERGLPPGNGCMLVFDATNGAPLVLLQDEGWLTELRTGMAGALAARACGMTAPRRIGIVGAGVQARFQLRALALVTPCRDALVFGRNKERAARYCEDLAADGFRVVPAGSVRELAQQCDLVVTATTSREPLLAAADLRPGMHVTAVGADGGGKHELDPLAFARADLCVVDSRSQCAAYGDASFALREGAIAADRLVELGVQLAQPPAPRPPQRISIADLTGVACQDLAIAGHVVRALAREQ